MVASPSPMWVFALTLFAAASVAVEGVGVNWGTITSRSLPPDTVVQLLKDNGINKVKFFDIDSNLVEALAGSGLEVMVAVPNPMLPQMGSYSAAEAWVKANVTRYTDKGVKITSVAIGNEPFLRFYKDMFTNSTFPALKNIQKALDAAGVGKTIKATIPLNADVYLSPPDNPVPSGGMFRTDVAELMGEIVEFYNQTGAPFMVNIYPFLSYLSDPNFPFEFAFFDGAAEPVVDKNGAKYTNVFDANHDTLVAALTNAGCGNVPIVVGEIGWPTDGEVHANVSLAERFYKGLMGHLASGKGTPIRPNANVEVYLFGLFDEDQKSTLPGDFERHWGIFGVDGQPMFPLDLSGTGKGKLVGAKGVEYLPKKWCVVNPDAAVNASKSDAAISYACDRADCTALGDGSSCGGLDNSQKASYAFNQYFQGQYQNSDSCGFDGLAVVTTKDPSPSSGACKFKVGISEHQTVSARSSSSSSSAAAAVATPSLLIFVGLLSLFFC